VGLGPGEYVTTPKATISVNVYLPVGYMLPIAVINSSFIGRVLYLAPQWKPGRSLCVTVTTCRNDNDAHPPQPTLT
jgi:hypothetical protein